jgi:hypothetical protein
MLKRIPFLFALLALGACCCGITEPQPQPVHAVRLDPWFYLLVEDRSAVEGGAVLGPEYARVLRRIDCEGVIHAGNGRIEDPCGFRHGDSDLLPAGTTLHPVDGVPGGQRLGAVLEGRLLIFVIRYPPD